MGFGVWGLGFGVWGLGFGVWGLGFGVWGLGVGDLGAPLDAQLLHANLGSVLFTDAKNSYGGLYFLDPGVTWGQKGTLSGFKAL